MSSINPASSQKAPISLVKSIGHLPTVFIHKMTGSNKIAPLFIAPQVDEEETEEVVELACGHIFRREDVYKARAARFGLLGGNNFLANLSIFEATRCPICESDRVKGAGG